MGNNYTIIRCGHCGKEMKRMTVGHIVYPGNPNYCGACNEKARKLPQ